jgi:hypothetical protein
MGLLGLPSSQRGKRKFIPKFLKASDAPAYRCNVVLLRFLGTREKKEVKRTTMMIAIDMSMAW